VGQIYSGDSTVRWVSFKPALTWLLLLGGIAICGWFLVLGFF